MTHSPPTTTTPSARLFTLDFVLLCLTSCLNFAVHMLAVTSLPLLVTRSLGGTEADVGLALSSFYVGAIVFRAPFGKLIDHWGRRSVLTACLVGLIIVSLCYASAPSMLVLVLARTLHGALFAGYGTAGSTLIGDIVPSTRRGEALGYYGLLSHVALAASPTIAFFMINNAGFTSLYLLSAGIALTGVSTLPIKEPVHLHHDAPRPKLIWGLFNPIAIRPSIILACFTMLYSAQVLFLPLYASVRGVGEPGAYFIVYGVVLILARGPACRISDRIGRGPSIIPGLLLGTISMLVLAGANTLVQMCVSAGLFAIAFALVTPSLAALVIDITRPRERGTALATHTTFFDIGSGLGSVLWGAMAQQVGFSATYALGSSLGLIGIALYAGLVWRRLKPVS